MNLTLFGSHLPKLQVNSLIFGRLRAFSQVLFFYVTRYISTYNNLNKILNTKILMKVYAMQQDTPQTCHSLLSYIIL